jgi:hypothetical protein
MKRTITNTFAALVVAAGGLYLSATPATAFAVEATCGDVSGECCTAQAGRCYCGPCSKILPGTAPVGTAPAT